MNSWKIVWDAYFERASKWSYAKELWRLSSWWLRTGLVASSASLAWAFIHFWSQRSDGQAMPLLLLAEFFFIIILDQIRGKTFASAYGSPDETISPAENEAYRPSRFLIFKRKLRQSSITKSHIQDLFDVVDAKISLEAHRNATLNRFFLFVSGLFTALVIAWIRGLDATQSATALLWLVVISAYLAPIFWMLPSRKERLSELKYFMLLYSKSLD